jgi:hypothetical protein
VGDAKTVKGKVGEALEFDGVDDYVNCGNDSSLDFTSEITLEAWAKPVITNANWPTVMAKWSGNSWFELYAMGIQDNKQGKSILLTHALKKHNPINPLILGGCGSNR